MPDPKRSEKRVGLHYSNLRKTRVLKTNHLRSVSAPRFTGSSPENHGNCESWAIENNSSPGQLVYEPFGGSETTIIAAKQTRRSRHAIELNPAYVDVAIIRWQDFSGQRATLGADGRPLADVAAERLRVAASREPGDFK